MLTFEMRVKLAWILVCMLVFASGYKGLYAQQAEPAAAAGIAALSPPFKAVTYSNTAPKGTTAPLFSHGYFIQFKLISTFPGESNIYLWNSSEQLEHEVAVWPAGAAKLSLISVDVGAGRQLAFACRAIKPDGSASAFIATSGLDGENPKYFDTGNYQATHLAQADDGSIWTVGVEQSENVQVAGVATKKWTNYDVLHHYSSAGVLLDHFLPRWGPVSAYVIQQIDSANNVTLSSYDNKNFFLAAYAAPFWGPQRGYAARSSIASQAWLKTINDGVVLYDGRTGILYRFSASNPTLVSQRVDLHERQGDKISGFTVLGDGTIYASWQTSDATYPHYFGLFKLSGGSSDGLARWSSVPQDNSDQGIPWLLRDVLGSDGTAIVYRTRADQVNWSNIQ